jgi:murein DD-endopeptidase MepM/ murein hydrolase activator NlpD
MEFSNPAMTQPMPLVCNTHRRPWLWFPAQGMIWISSIGILGGSVANAQTPGEIITPAAINSSPAQSIPVISEAKLPAQTAPEVSAATIREAYSVAAPTVSLPAPITSGTGELSDRRDGYISPTNYRIGASTGYPELNPTVPPQNSTLVKIGSKPTIGGAITSSYSRLHLSGRSSYVPKSVVLSRVGFDSGAVGTTTPSGQTYYNQMIRSLGRLDNGNVRLVFPLSIPAVMTSLFGWRTHPITGNLRFHSGVDLAAPLGAPVLAAYAGRVAIADFLSGYGFTIVLRHHKDTQETLYAHLSEILVQPGAWVKQGAIIGRVGSTGNSTGPHLHFESRQLTDEGWVALDPGVQLEYALAQLVKALQTARSSPQPHE